MRKIKVKEWTAKTLDGNEKTESLIDALTWFLASKPASEQLKGLEAFNFFKRVSEAFEKASKTKELILEEAEYEFFKQEIEKSIPAFWASNKSLVEAIEEFLQAKKCEVK